MDWMSYNCTLLYEFSIGLSIVVPFTTPSETSRVGTWRSIFFRVQTLMVSDDYGLDELLSALLCECNVELSIVVPFPTCKLERASVFFLPRSDSHGLGWL